MMSKLMMGLISGCVLMISCAVVVPPRTIESAQQEFKVRSSVRHVVIL